MSHKAEISLSKTEIGITLQRQSSNEEMQPNFQRHIFLLLIV